MTEFKLVEKTKVGREECYHYESEDGQRAVFHADTDEAWNWIILEGDRSVVEKVIDRCCELGFLPGQIETFDIDLPRPARGR